jgi:Ca-activated chloride channel homolog
VHRRAPEGVTEMRRMILTLLAVTVTLAATPIASANAVLLQGDSGEVVPTLRQQIHTRIEAQVSTTEVTTTFTELTDSTVLFCFGVPEQAAAYELVLIVDGEEEIADVTVGDQAEYPDGLGTGVADDLADYLGENPMRTWVTDLPDGAEVGFRLSYVELLPYEFGQVTYTFPLVPFSGDTGPIDELVVELELLTERTIEMFTTNLGSGTTTEVSDTHMLASLELEDADRASDLTAVYEVLQTDLGLRLWAYRPDVNPWVDEADGYFLLLLEPPTESDEVSDKVFTYVLDRSGSMSGTKIADARSAAVTAIANLNPGDLFNVIAFDDGLEFFASSPQQATADNRAAASGFVESIYADGSTGIHAALLAALGDEWETHMESPPSVDVACEGGECVDRPSPFMCGVTMEGDGALPVEDDAIPLGNDDDALAGDLPRVMLFLTDGLPTAGVTNPQQILEDVADANDTDTAIYSVAIGADADEQFLGALAQQNRGISIEVTGTDDLQTQLEDLFFRINNPLLVRPELDLQGGDTHDVLPGELPDLFLGNQLVIVGRYAAPGDLHAELTGEIDGEPALYEFDGDLPEQDKVHSFVGRIWAVTMVNHLLARIAAEGETTELVDEITALGEAYGINTPYTPFAFGSGDDDDWGDDDDYAPPADAYDEAAVGSVNACACVVDAALTRHPTAAVLALLTLSLIVRRKRGQI